MAFSYKNSKGITYYLHGKPRQTGTGKTAMLFFFSKEIKEGALDKVPDGYEVSETKTSLLVLKKK